MAFLKNMRPIPYVPHSIEIAFPHTYYKKDKLFSTVFFYFEIFIMLIMNFTMLFPSTQIL